MKWISQEPPKLLIRVQIPAGAFYYKTMDPFEHLQNILEKTEILKSPKHRLSTFGETKILYFYLSEVKGFKDRSRLRRGLVIAEKPKIITPDFFKNKFEGFGREAQDLGNWLSEKYSGSTRGLEYHFKNESKSVQIEHSSIKNLIKEIEKRIADQELNQSAIIHGPDETWQIALMKFIMDECIASFGVNIKELDEHGFFESAEESLKNKRKMIEQLFGKAKKNHLYISMLGKKLQDFGLFKEYEDEFFNLLK